MPSFMYEFVELFICEPCEIKFEGITKSVTNIIPMDRNGSVIREWWYKKIFFNITNSALKEIKFLEV